MTRPIQRRELLTLPVLLMAGRAMPAVTVYHKDEDVADVLESQLNSGEAVTVPEGEYFVRRTVQVNRFANLTVRGILRGPGSLVFSAGCLLRGPGALQDVSINVNGGPCDVRKITFSGQQWTSCLLLKGTGEIGHVLVA